MKAWVVTASYDRREDAAAAAELLRELGGRVAYRLSKTETRNPEETRSGKLFLANLPAGQHAMQRLFVENGFAAGSVSPLSHHLEKRGLIAIRNKGKNGLVRYVRRIRVGSA